MTATVPYNEMTPRRKPLFTKCCGCFPLRMGCFVLGYLNLAINIFNSLGLLMITIYLGVTTHGFDHFDHQSEQSPELEETEKPLLTRLGILLLVVLISNLAWIIIKIACLVGLHKRRPGPIRVYVCFATVRLTLSMIGIIYLLSHSNIRYQSIIAHFVDIILASYFILVYYTYAVQLEIENQESEENRNQLSANIAYVYPTKPDKQILVVS